MSIFKSTFLAENKFHLSGTSAKQFHLYFEIEAKKHEVKGDRIPLNISLVVDRSGSMAGDKLKYVKRAVDFVIDNLASDDCLSIVQYDNEIDVVSRSSQVLDKKALHKKVEKIQERGMTNMSGGMLEGYSQVESTKKENFVNRVLLLSDGLANEGVTEPVQLQQIVQKKFRALGIGLSTFGVGADFNEVLMTNLSEYGGANYYFIDSPEKIPSIFADELAGLLSVVAQGTRVTLEFPGEYFKCSHVYGYPFDAQTNSVEINFNDVISEEKKAVLFKFEILKPIDREVGFNLQLSFDDVVEKMERVVERFEFKVNRTNSESDFKAGVEARVVEQVVYFVANQIYEDAINKGDQRDFKGAKELIGQAREYMETHFKSYPQSEELKKLYDLIVEYAQRIPEMENMSVYDYTMTQKMTRSAQYMSKRKK